MYKKKKKNITTYLFPVGHFDLLVKGRVSDSSHAASSEELVI